MTVTTQLDEERFLVLAPTGRDAALTLKLLARMGLAAVACRDLNELCQRFEREGAAALMIAEEVFSTGLGRLPEVLAMQSSWSDIPVLIFTGTPAGLSRRPSTDQLLASLGNVTLLDRPLRPVTMLSAARTAMRARLRQYEARAELFAQQRAVRERDQFLAMLGHELRNPLSAITMAINLDDHRRSRYRDIIGRQVGHLTRLVDDLLDVSRVTSGKIVLRRESVDLIELTRRCVAALLPTVARGTQLSHVANVQHGVWVSGDAVRLEQVITNLINNAIKYTAAGGSIEVEAHQEGEQAVVSVRDTGVGLAPEMVDRVFELFTQVEGSLDRAKGGMGIGLTLVRSLVGLHGGSVEAASPGLGKGSVFTVRLPAIAAPSRFDEHVTRERVAEGARKDQSGPVPRLQQDVLIVEDNEDSRDLLATILRKRGHQVFTAEDGPSGVAAAIARRPRVLLVDIGLPGLDGYGVARQVREELGSSVYMVAITGYGQPEDRRRAVEAGFDLHLTKPVDVSVIDRLLAHGDLLQRSSPAS